MSSHLHDREETSAEPKKVTKNARQTQHLDRNRKSRDSRANAAKDKITIEQTKDQKTPSPIEAHHPTSSAAHLPLARRRSRTRTLSARQFSR
jgi:hypothetical protein